MANIILVIRRDFLSLFTVVLTPLEELNAIGTIEVVSELPWLLSFLPTVPAFHVFTY
jgi:hypothetical protein